MSRERVTRGCDFSENRVDRDAAVRFPARGRPSPKIRVAICGAVARLLRINAPDAFFRWTRDIGLSNENVERRGGGAPRLEKLPPIITERKRGRDKAAGRSAGPRASLAPHRFLVVSPTAFSLPSSAPKQMIRSCTRACVCARILGSELSKLNIFVWPQTSRTAGSSFHSRAFQLPRLQAATS